MTAHLFVVSKETFPIHLEYMFAWTWAWEDWHENPWMISDVASCRVWDKILFFVTWVGFFGSFRVKKEYFLDKTGDTYMNAKNKKWEDFIIKKLTNRILLEPTEIYSYWVSEWDILDNISNLPSWKNSKIQDFLWSLLYRKLDWNRWCTPIFDYEYDFILAKIKTKNNHINLVCDWYSFVDDTIIEWEPKEYDNSKIKHWVILKDYIKNEYLYSIEQKINIIKWNVENQIINWNTSSWKLRTQRLSESELELFFSAYWNSNTEQWVEISKVIWTKIKYFWTQVVCSFWAKRIDILTIDNENTIRVIELKDTEYYDWIIDNQLKYYISWIDQYMKNDEEKVIEPIIVINKSDWLSYDDINKKIINLVEVNNINSKVLPIKIFFWNIENWKINFNLFR